jgi:DNA-binding response OmpR family regulator/HPt (histidine-containing phosphotransfer) domain-containing protein
MRILIVEDDEALRDLLTERLSQEHYAIDVACDGRSGWEFVSTYDYDLLILDVMLPEMDGLELCQKARQSGQTLPILMLTAQDSSAAKITALNAGADDYVVKPFDEPELMARIRALLRRSSSNPLPVLTWGDLWLNSSTHEITYGGILLDLSAKEYSLLEMMMRESHHVFSKEEILDSLWSSDEFPVDATVRSHMRRLRHKLTAVGAPPDLIATSHGRGYYLKPPMEMLVPSAILAKVEQLPQHQAAYHELMNQTWQKHRGNCQEKVQILRSALGQLQNQSLDAANQAEAYRMAHALVGTLGTFGLTEAMELARCIEQELHPDIYPEASQARYLLALAQELHTWIEQTESLVLLLSQPTPVAKPQSDIRVMLVDDDPTFLQTLPRQLQGYGFQVATLEDPQQFWTVLEEIQPAVLILDVQMPNVSGFELCQRLRSQPDWQKIPVMFLSVFADAKTQHEAFAVGADDYLCKPITAQNLSDRIQNRLQRMNALLAH